MCVQATTALTIASVLGQAISFQQQKKQQQYAWWQQKKQNELAKENAIQRYASEQLKIRQTLKQASQKDLEATLKSRRVRATYITEAGGAGLALSGSTSALLANYYRTEGNYKTALQNNMAINISQFESRLLAMETGIDEIATPRGLQNFFKHLCHRELLTEAANELYYENMVEIQFMAAQDVEEGNIPFPSIEDFASIKLNFFWRSLTDFDILFFPPLVFSKGRYPLFKYLTVTFFFSSNFKNF